MFPVIIEDNSDQTSNLVSYPLINCHLDKELS